MSARKSDLGHKKLILSTDEVITSIFKSYLTHYKDDLGHWRSYHNHFKRYLSKGDLSQ